MRGPRVLVQGHVHGEEVRVRLPRVDDRAAPERRQDVAFVQVSPPDAAGNHSFGLISDFVQAAVAKARVVIAEVNECVPVTHGDAVLPASRIDCAVHVARTPVEVMPAQIGETDRAIARFVADYVEDGAVLQVGIGAVPDAILQLLRELTDETGTGLVLVTHSSEAAQICHREIHLKDGEILLKS